MRFPSKLVREATRTLLISHGVPELHAEYVSDTLVDTSLCGIDTHGMRLLPTYVLELKGGRSNPTPRFRLSSPHGPSSIFYADNALGVVAANVAMREAMSRAASCGIAALAVRDSNHFGAAGYYARLAARQDQIGLVFSNSDALVAPANGVTALNGSNPMAMAAPGLGEDGFFLDMATSQLSYSRVMAERAKQGIAPETGPSERAPLTPLGGYKGQGLGTMIQILCALLSDMPIDTELSHLYAPPYDAPRLVSHFLIAIDVRAFTEPTRFRTRVSQLLSSFRRSPADADVPVMVAGDPESAMYAERLRDGIPLGDAEIACLSAFLTSHAI